ncbi:MAG: DUF3108 domain-containing protein [Acidobacteria bacterium]|nr:DUF3108 domain-containing protein [Acidobacteriota bacterium]
MRAAGWLLLAAGAVLAQSTGEEALIYAVNWPSGLSLGEARLETKRAGARWQIQLTLEAALPGFAVNDRYQSIVTETWCSLELEKQFAHGQRKGHERTSFDPARSVATRETLGGGGKSELPAPACPRDALAYLYWLRRELGQGRLPAPQTVYFGAAYQIRLEYGGTQTLRLGDERTQADRLVAVVKGPVAELKFEVFFARDPARTLVLARVPFPSGVFSMELVR